MLPSQDFDIALRNNAPILSYALPSQFLNHFASAAKPSILYAVFFSIAHDGYPPTVLEDDFWLFRANVEGRGRKHPCLFFSNKSPRRYALDSWLSVAAHRGIFKAAVRKTPNADENICAGNVILKRRETRVAYYLRRNVEGWTEGA